MRIGLLFALTSLISLFQEPLFGLHSTDLVEAELSLHSLIVLLGGVFIIYTFTREIFHMLGVDELEHGERDGRSFGSVLP